MKTDYSMDLARLGRFFAAPRMLFYLLPWVMLLLLTGTLAQRSIGLYQAEKQFFSSLILWLGPVPLPGMAMVLAVMALSLTAKLWLKSPFHRRSIGTIMTHMGAILLLVGGLLTALFSEEGFMILDKGDTASSVSDYHQRELVIRKNDQILTRVPFADLAESEPVPAPALPFTVNVTMLCRNCTHNATRYVASDDRGLAEQIALSPATLRQADEENQSGIALAVRGAGTTQDGRYITYEQAVLQPDIRIGTDHYTITLQKAQRHLPFAVQLLAFEKQVHPGTHMAKEYQSELALSDGDLHWNAAVRMNEPMRYRGYTIYQSAFIEKDGKQLSVLTIVKNAGRVFPYVSSVMMCAGLLLHLLLRMPSRTRPRETS